MKPPVHPNVSIMRKCEVFPIEFVVRGYLTGSTSTSLWAHYKNGGETIANPLEDGMEKNVKLPRNIVTPTTKEKEHDRPISLEDIVKENWMNKEDLDYCVEKTLEIFNFSQQVAKERNLILVDTKYEFGKDPKTGKIYLIDEINTPDSSRYWIQNTYEERVLKNKQEPDMIDKEFLALWFADRSRSARYFQTVTRGADRIKSRTEREIRFTLRNDHRREIPNSGRAIQPTRM